MPNKLATFSKQELRKHFLDLRCKIPSLRREGASKMLFHNMIDEISDFSKVLSFCSFNEEIDLILFNRYLATTGRLYLPHMEKNNLRIFKIISLDEELIATSTGLKQPIEEVCEEINPSQLDLILVPGVAFDSKGHRLGYGRGYYDRFLKEYPSIPTWGLGFQEQLTSFPLPIEQTDIPIKKLFLF